MTKGDGAKSPPVTKTLVDGVETYSAQIEGQTIIWDRDLTYGQHLQIGQLLGCQNPASDKPDEMLFIIMHQTMELWIKLMLHETRLAIELLREDRIGQAGKRLDRIATIMRHMIQSWEVLATLSPPEFLSFRGYLKKASGFQSHQYRELEFVMGTKRPDLILVHHGDDVAVAKLHAALEVPSFYDEVLRVLARAGLNIPADVTERDWSQPYEPRDEVENAWLEIYNNTDDHWDLYMLAEKVTAIEYYFQEWRFKHLKTVARVIGQKPGTGGSAGVGYLEKALSLRFFPELWAMRTRMSVSNEGGKLGA